MNSKTSLKPHSAVLAGGSGSSYAQVHNFAIDHQRINFDKLRLSDSKP
jgi:hypothetical protein